MTVAILQCSGAPHRAERTSMTTFSSDDIPDLTGTTAIVTGANSGIGRAAAAALAARGARVILAVRNTDKGHEAAR